MSKLPAVLVTGASTGIGAVYADRFAKRGHDLVLVARNLSRLTEVANRLRAEYGVNVEILNADLTKPEDLRRVEARLTEDAKIGVLVNNAGTTIPGSFVQQTPDAVETLITLNTTAPARLAAAVAPRFAREGQGAIVNISSVVGFAPELGLTVYGATKAFLTYLSHGLRLELEPKGVYVQAVLPAATRTEIWDHAGTDVNSLQAVMEVDELVDAALAGYDLREAVTIPTLHDDGQWRNYEGARQAILPNISQVHAAPRYKQVA
ncbi:SDR family oxidoreductase [Burkholderia gladioli]|uniref:SDR family NAD(P)-dependent oxidoreductase n=1 Tax=Burkholderia gladioli TaxID=28095 RepID=UPI001CF3ECA5|nr:SDR family oxidoreductase [Burkholderia gladioli]MCA8166345.1 SDR family oxidoreductase [Burkholderia gladioli]